MMKRSLIVLALLSSACGATNPMSPTTDTLLFVSPELTVAYELADYRVQHVRAIELVELPDAISARYLTNEHRVQLNSRRQWTDVTAAGAIAHELRHAEGYMHDCADGVRDASNDGAWAIHAQTLERLGATDVAHDIRSLQFCVR